MKESMSPAILWGKLGLSLLIGFSGSGLIPGPVVLAMIALMVAMTFAGHILGIHSFHGPGGVAKMMGSFFVGAAIGAVIVISIMKLTGGVRER